MTDPNPTVAALLASGRRELTTTSPEDTAVIDADEPQPPMPTEGAPHAYVAVRRAHSVNADRPEWETDPHLIPAHEVDELIYWNTQPDVSLLPIGPDGDTGTRAIVEEFRPAEVPWSHVDPIVQQAIKTAKTPTTNSNGDSVYSRDNLADAIQLLVAAIQVLDRPSDGEVTS